MIFIECDTLSPRRQDLFIIAFGRRRRRCCCHHHRRRRHKWPILCDARLHSFGHNRPLCNVIFFKFNSSSFFSLVVVVVVVECTSNLWNQRNAQVKKWKHKYQTKWLLGSRFCGFFPFCSVIWLHEFRLRVFGRWQSGIKTERSREMLYSQGEARLSHIFCYLIEGVCVCVYELSLHLRQQGYIPWQPRLQSVNNCFKCVHGTSINALSSIQSTNTHTQTQTPSQCGGLDCGVKVNSSTIISIIK